MIEMLNIFQKIFRGRVKQELDVNINATTVDENSHNQQEEIVPSIKCSSSNILQNDKIDVYTHEEFKNAINFGEKVQCDIVIR